MEVIILQSGKEDQIIETLLTKIQEVLEELQVGIKKIQLNQIPYYEGYKEPISGGIIDSIEKSCGVIMASRVELLSVSGSLCAFFEHCSEYVGEKLFQKPLFTLTVSDWRGEREAAEYMLHAWSILGGIEFGKLGIFAESYHKDKETIITHTEKMTEDFYRSIKQTHYNIKNNDHLIIPQKNQKNENCFEPILAQTIKHQEISYKGYDHIRSTQEKDIEDIVNIFKKQLQEGEEGKEERELYVNTATYSKPTFQTARQMLSSLPEYFKSQQALGFYAVVQYHLLGGEPFQAYITIQDGQCTFQEGVYPGAEIEVTAPEGVFENIFTKKITSQKAFMLGQLKVRGNFMLLSKIDEMFRAI